MDSNLMVALLRVNPGSSHQTIGDISRTGMARLSVTSTHSTISISVLETSGLIHLNYKTYRISYNDVTNNFN